MQPSRFRAHTIQMEVAARPTSPIYSHARAHRLAAGAVSAITTDLVDEAAVALSYNAIPYAVLMASPADLDDLAIGFSLTDGIAAPADISAIHVYPVPDGWSVDIRLTPPALERYLQRRQTRVQRSFTSCGICGTQHIADLPQVGRCSRPPPLSPRIEAIRMALADLPRMQPLNRRTGAAHAAAWVTSGGIIQSVREDVGRHNALDKLIGARTRFGRDDPGFCLITSRCSFEMVQKAAAANFRTLVAISAPTTLAVRHAQEAGLTLVALARHDSQLVYAGGDTLLVDDSMAEAHSIGVTA